MKPILLFTIMMPILSFSQSFIQVKADIENAFRSVPGKFALAFQDLSTNRSLFLNEKEMFHAASTMKTPVMIEVFKQANEGKFYLEDSVLVKNEFRSIVDGSPYQMDLGQDSDDSMYKRIGSKATIRELVYQMITVSSNLATNILIDLVDAKKVTATVRSLGANDIQVLRGVEDGKAFRQGLNNITNAYDLFLIMKAIANGTAVDSSASKAMLNVLFDQRFNDLIPALLPNDVRVAHKTGSITGVEHDSGIVFLPDGRKYILVILSKELKDANEGKKIIAKVSKMVYDTMRASN
ncbi:MAG: serine hydrolase [Ignavibacteriales bacterium]|nr:serine hydrolase [Ignavibacteriales bacterium]